MGLSNQLSLRLSKVESYVMVLNVVTLVYLPYKNAGCDSRSDSFISIVTTNIAQSKYTTFTVIVGKPIWQLLVSNSNTSNMIGKDIEKWKWLLVLCNKEADRTLFHSHSNPWYIDTCTEHLCKYVLPLFTLFLKMKYRLWILLNKWPKYSTCTWITILPSLWIMRR